MRVLVALAVLVAAEIAVLIAVGQQIGLLGLLGVLVGAAVLGSWAIGREGRRSMSALVRTARSGRPAEAEVADGMLVALAGVLLVLPGLISDVVALVLLLPPVRRVLARRVVASARERTTVVRVAAGAPLGAGPTGFGPTGFGPTGFGPTVDGRSGSGPRGFGSGPAAGPVVEGRVIEGEIVDDAPDGDRPARGTGAA